MKWIITNTKYLRFNLWTYVDENGQAKYKSCFWKGVNPNDLKAEYEDE